MATENSNVNGYGPSASAPYAMQPPKRVFSIWWPMSFLIAWFVFCATGGGLIGGSFNEGTVSYCYEEGACDEGPDEGMLIGGIVFVSLGGVCASVFWILLIVWLVKRSHARSSQNNVYYVNQPMAAPGGMAYHPQQQGWQYPPPMHPQQQQYQSALPQQMGGSPVQHSSYPASTQDTRHASPANMSSPSQPPPSDGLIPYTEDRKTCSSCGTAVTTPFCSQCGHRNA